MEIYQQQLVRKFRQVLQDSWDQYRTKYGVEDTFDNFIDFLLDCQLIKSSMLQKYTIQKIFEAEIANYKTKSALISALSERYQLSERIIWKYLRQ